MSSGGQKIINVKIKDRMKKRELQSKNAASNKKGGARGNLKAGRAPSGGRRGVRGGSKGKRGGSRSASNGSLEDHVDPSQMYEYFMEQSVGISKKAEGDRA